MNKGNTDIIVLSAWSFAVGVLAGIIISSFI